MNASTMLVCGLVVVACGKVASVQVDGCRNNDDCTSTMLGEDCCDRCAPIVGTKSSVEAREQACARRSSGEGRCPALDCPKITQTVTCSAGRCIGVVKEAE